MAAGVTDALDGAIARLTHTKTTLGAYLDPAADKLLLMSAFVALALHAAGARRWLVVIVLSRDVMLVLGYFLLFTMTQHAMEVRPSVAGKLSTFLQLCCRHRRPRVPVYRRHWVPPMAAERVLLRHRRGDGERPACST